MWHQNQKIETWGIRLLPKVVFTKLENQKIETRGIRLLVGSEGRSGVRAGRDSSRICCLRRQILLESLPTRALHSGPRTQPGAETSGFNLFDFRVSWNHLRQGPKPEVSIYFILVSHETTQGFKFSCQNSRETIQNFLTTRWNQDTKKKCAVSLLKPRNWLKMLRLSDLAGGTASTRLCCGH